LSNQENSLPIDLARKTVDSKAGPDYRF